MKETVLIAEDEAELRLVLKNNLEFVGYRVLEAKDGQDAYDRLVRDRPDLVLLDIRMPRLDGFTVLRKARDRGILTPVIFVTARDQETDRIAGFEIGADDYVTKPFSIAELLARVRAILRRAAGTPSRGIERAGDLEIDLDHYTVTRGERKIALGFFEAEILRVLLRRPGEAVTRKELLDEVWGEEAIPTPRVVDNHILNLRKKIEKDPANPVHLVTAHRVGYRFLPSPP